MYKFFEKVDFRSRKAMTEFLTEHFRYSTMNSWNGSTSYANCLKIHHLGFPPEILDQLFGMIQIDDFYYEINELIDIFGESHAYSWQADFNGRSGGYLVLYQGGLEPSGYQSRCYECGQLNYKSVKETGSNVCGKCGTKARVDFKEPHMRRWTKPGLSTDQYEDFSDWDMSDLRDRVKLIQEFDLLCDSIVDYAYHMAKEHTVVDETIMVPTTIKVIKEKEIA